MKNQKGIYKSYLDLLQDLPIINYLKVNSFNSKNKYGNILINCTCKCGKVCIKYFSDLNINKAISCGCYHKLVVSNIGLKNKKYDTNILTDNLKNYIQGLYAADGYINKYGKSEITLQIADIDFLNDLKNKIFYTGPIYQNKIRCRLTISDEKYNDIFKHANIFNSKTFTFKIPDFLKNNKDFWRGYVDGDGCIFKYNYKYINLGVNLVGNKNVLEDFIKYCSQYIDMSKKNMSQLKSNKDIYQINITGKNSLIILNELYRNLDLNNDIYLKRKYNMYLEIKKYYE